MPEGIVKWFDPDNDMGVIGWGEGRPDAVVQRDTIWPCCHARPLAAGDAVVLDVIEDAQGVWAANVRRIRPCC